MLRCSGFLVDIESVVDYSTTLHIELQDESTTI